MRVPDLTEQLRRYGEAAEHAALDAEMSAMPLERLPRQREQRTLAVAAVILTLLGGAIAVRSLRTDAGQPEVVAVGPLSSATSTVPAPGGPSTSPTGRTVSGQARWIGDSDPRGTLRVGACPRQQSTQACPGWQSVAVDEDGSFEIALPSSASDGPWDVAAYVSVSSDDCVFLCPWQGAIVGPAAVVSPSAPTEQLQLGVEARVVDLTVLDRDGRPFTGGGVLLRDTRCTTDPCPAGLEPMFKQASPHDGRARVVLEPSRSYRIHAQAVDTGWPSPKFGIDGHQYWTSAELVETGDELRDGLVLRVDGAPGDDS